MKYTKMFLSGFIFGTGCFMFLLIAAVVNDKITEYKKSKILEQRGLEMIIKYDKRKKRCEELGGKYNIIETETYYNEVCTNYFERTN